MVDEDITLVPRDSLFIYIIFLLGILIMNVDSLRPPLAVKLSTLTRK